MKNIWGLGENVLVLLRFAREYQVANLQCCCLAFLEPAIERIGDSNRLLYETLDVISAEPNLSDWLREKLIPRLARLPNTLIAEKLRAKTEDWILMAIYAAKAAKADKLDAIITTHDDCRRFYNECCVIRASEPYELCVERCVPLPEVCASVEDCSGYVPEEDYKETVYKAGRFKKNK